MAFPGSACQAKEVISKLTILISNQKVKKKKFLCQREQEQMANKPGSYTIRAGSRSVTGPFHCLSIAAFRPVHMLSQSQDSHDVIGDGNAPITHHSSRCGPSRRQAESLNANGDIRGTYSRSLAIRSKLSHKLACPSHRILPRSSP